MSNTKISISYDSEKLAALVQAVSKEDIEKQLVEQIEKLYKKKVAIAVQKYIEGKNNS